ncbi:hypothetical protein GCM10009663_45850 [Kitasatospora arboriphila]|uniref:Uncharacterized protein n=1 Tax=Kitasatospora arboriphila TaxID=258052 RepID=A0ABN1TQB0_9ACTN
MGRRRPGGSGRAGAARDAPVAGRFGEAGEGFADVQDERPGGEIALSIGRLQRYTTGVAGPTRVTARPVESVAGRVPGRVDGPAAAPGRPPEARSRPAARGRCTPRHLECSEGKVTLD